MSPKFLLKYTYRLSQSVSFDDLLLPVSVDDRIEALKRPASHEVPHAFLLYPEPLYLVVDVEEQGVVPGGIVRGSDEEAARTGLDQHVDCLALGAVGVEPREHSVRIDRRVQILD